MDTLRILVLTKITKKPRTSRLRTCSPLSTSLFTSRLHCLRQVPTRRSSPLTSDVSVRWSVGGEVETWRVTEPSRFRDRQKGDGRRREGGGCGWRVEKETEREGGRQRETDSDRERVRERQEEEREGERLVCHSSSWMKGSESTFDNRIGIEMFPPRLRPDPRPVRPVRLSCPRRRSGTPGTTKCRRRLGLSVGTPWNPDRTLSKDLGRKGGRCGSALTLDRQGTPLCRLSGPVNDEGPLLGTVLTDPSLE